MTLVDAIVKWIDGQSEIGSYASSFLDKVGGDIDTRTLILQDIFSLFECEPIVNLVATKGLKFSVFVALPEAETINVYFDKNIIERVALGELSHQPPKIYIHRDGDVFRKSNEEYRAILKETTDFTATYRSYLDYDLLKRGMIANSEISNIIVIQQSCHC